MTRHGPTVSWLLYLNVAVLGGRAGGVKDDIGKDGSDELVGAGSPLGLGEVSQVERSRILGYSSRCSPESSSFSSLPI